jgi:HlyD family secretion protein
LPNPDARLRPGLTARIVILGDQRKDVLSIPRQGLFMRDGKRVAYVETGKDFEPREVRIRSESESRAVIEGLNAGAKVALVDPTAPRKEGNPGGAAQDAGGGAN